MNTSLENLLQLFGVVTVMDVHVYKLAGATYGTNTLDFSKFQDTGLCLDTLKISNIKQSEAQKKFTIGKFNIPLPRVGKKINIDMQDALGKKGTLEYFFHMPIIDNEITIDNQFADLICLEGKTWFVNLSGEKQDVFITIPCFLPKGALNINMQADGEAGVFDLSGSAYPIIYNNKMVYYIIGTKSKLKPEV